MNLQKSRAVFVTNPETEKLVEFIDQIISQIEDFNSFLPMAVNLSNEGMHERHWDILSMKIHIKINPIQDTTFCFKKLLELKLENHLELIEEVSNRAAKEYSLMKDIEAMTSKWEDVQFNFYSSAKSDINLINNFEELIAISDEHLGITSNLIVSP